MVPQKFQYKPKLVSESRDQPPNMKLAWITWWFYLQLCQRIISDRYASIFVPIQGFGFFCLLWSYIRHSMLAYLYWSKIHIFMGDKNILPTIMSASFSIVYFSYDYIQWSHSQHSILILINHLMILSTMVKNNISGVYVNMFVHIYRFSSFGLLISYSRH